MLQCNVMSSDVLSGSPIVPFMYSQLRTPGPIFVLDNDMYEMPHETDKKFSAFYGPYSFIHSFIQEFIRRPSRNLLRAIPSPATAIQISLKQPAKRTFITFRQDTDFQGESINSRWRGQQWKMRDAA